MKPSLWMVLATLCLSALPVAAQTTSPASSPAPRSRLLRCGTDSSQRVRCAAQGEIASVRLVRDLSAGNCGPAGSWGWTRDAVWTDNGCRGDFAVTYGRYGSAPDTITRRINCGTLGSRRDECSAHGVVDSVRLVKRSFFSRCEKGSTWGYGDTLVWAGNGCKGEFEVTYRRKTPPPAPAPRPAPPQPDARIVTCGSASAIQVQCSTGGAVSRVTVVRNLGSSRCREGENWKLSGTTILAGNGCRAEFEATYARDTTSGMRPMAPAGRIISCGNASGSAMSCNAFGTVATVRLQRDRSGGRCGQWGSWGLEDRSIWVTRGCYGDFELTYTG